MQEFACATTPHNTDLDITTGCERLDTVIDKKGKEQIDNTTSYLTPVVSTTFKSEIKDITFVTK